MKVILRNKKTEEIRHFEAVDFVFKHKITDGWDEDYNLIEISEYEQVQYFYDWDIISATFGIESVCSAGNQCNDCPEFDRCERRLG